jgi:hypothetical protein
MPKAEKPKGASRKVPFERPGLDEEIDEQSRVPVKQTKKAPKRRDGEAQVLGLAWPVAPLTPTEFWCFRSTHLCRPSFLSGSLRLLAPRPSKSRWTLVQTSTKGAASSSNWSQRRRPVQPTCTPRRRFVLEDDDASDSEGEYEDYEDFEEAEIVRPCARQTVAMPSSFSSVSPRLIHHRK